MKSLLTCLSLIALLALTTPASAVFVTVDHQNGPLCDDLLVPDLVDELGFVGVFPEDEQIDAIDTFTDLIACPGSYQPDGTPNNLVVITNLTKTPFDNLWYVADPETRFTNVDGFVNGQEAFKIDRVGLNRPLVGESGIANGIFEPGETWRFIVDGYSNLLGLPPSAFFSVGLVGGLSGGDDVSSASIIATPIPEPASCLLMVVGLAAVGFHGRRVG